MSFEGLLSLRKPYEREVEVQEPTLGEEVIETAREAFEFSPVHSFVRGLFLAEARRTGNILDANSARAQLDDAGLRDQLTVPDQGITQEALDILIRRKRTENRRAELFARSPGGFTRGTAKIATAIGTSIFDPINVASAFVPVVSQARYMQLLRAQAGVIGRTGVRAGVGFVEGAAGAALVEPLILGVAQAEQADYDGVDSLLNIAFGGVFGGGLHAVGGLGYEASRRLRGLEALPPREQIDAAVQQAIIDADEALPKPVDVPEPVRVPVAEKFKPTAIKPIDAYIESAKQISQELRRTLDIDINDAKAVSKATGEKAVSIAEFVKRTGGIVDDGGELSARDVTNKRYPGLVRKDTPENRQMAGMDSVRERLYDAGYFPDRTSYNDISDSEIFDALAEDLSGTRIWSGAVREKLSKFLGNKEYITQMEMEGFSRDMSVTQIADRLRMMDDAARAEIDQPASIEPDALLEYERIAAELNAQASAASVIDSVNPETRRAALTTGVAQAIDAREINVESIVSLDPSLARGGEDFSLNSARNAAVENFRPDQRTMVDFEAAAEAAERSVEKLSASVEAAQARLDEALRSANEAVDAVNREARPVPTVTAVKEMAAKYGKLDDEPPILGEGEGRVLKREPGNFTDIEKTAFDDFLATRDDADRIRANLEQHKGTPFAAQAVEGIFVRQAMRMLIDGQTPKFESSLNSKNARKIRETLTQKGEQGVWQILEINGGLMGAAAKPVNNINSSFINCSPSKDCAQYCYATKGNYRYANVIVKSELVTLAIELDPVRAAKRVAAEYKATAEFANNKALRLFDKGDGDSSWIPFIKELNNQGIRIQVFSKVPDFLRSVPEMNLRLLSIDDSNMKLADQNPDLPVAFVYTGKNQIDTLAKLAARNQVQVVLPVKLGQKILDGTEITELKSAVPKIKPFLCPIDSGFKKLGKTSQKGTWNCTKCDVNGGVGCFHGTPTKAVLNSREVNPATPQERAQRILDLRRQIDEITSGTLNNLADTGRIPPGRVEGLLSEVDALLGELLRDFDKGPAAKDAVTIGSGVVEPGNGTARAVQERVGTIGGIPVVRGVSEPATYSTNEQLQNYLSEGPVESQAGTRAIAAQRAAVKAVDDLRSSGDVLGLALSRDFAARQKVSLVGQKIASTEDFATLAQVYRDPRFETLRYVFVDNDGNVVGQAGVTSRLPGSALAFAGPDATDFFSELGSRARQLGAKQVYLLHNHPSGIARPSQADIRFTENAAEYFKSRGIKFADHVVIDTNEYTVIKANGEFETIQKDFGQPSLARLKGMVDRPIKRPEVLASIAREIQFDDKAVVLVVTNNQMIVQNIVEVPFDKVMSYGNTPEGKRQALFALRRFTLSSDGAFIFAISKNEEALLPFKNVTADQIVIDQRGFGRQAWPEQPLGRVLPAERRGRISPETGPEFDYLRGMSTSDTIRQIGVREEGAAYSASDPNTEMRPFREAIERADLYAQAVRAAADRIGNDDAARAAMQAATRGELGASEIDILLDRLKQENTRVRSRLKQAREVFTAEDKIDTLEGDAMKAADSLANNIKLDATIAARNAALSLAARTKAAGRILTQFRDNPSEGLLSILGGSSFARFGSKDSAFHWQRTYFTRWTKGMLADLERDGLAEAFTSNAYGRDVARALYQLGRAEPRLEGLDDNAVKIAKIVYKYREDSRNTRNRFGAWIRDLTGYITRQQHDFMKIRAAGSKAWNDFVRQRLDIDRSLQPGQNLEEFLDTVYADLAAGRHLSAIDEEAQAYTTPGSLARRASQSRVIYFKDADAEFDYLTEFGVGKLHEAILGDLSRAAQQAGLMRILGPNPQFTLKAVTSEVEAGLVRDPEMRQKFAESKDTAESLLSMLDGRANVPGNAMSARVGSNVRVTQAMAKLGGAVISAVTDLPVYASQIKYQGRGGLLSGIGEGIGALLQGRAKGERKRILNMIDTVADNLVGGVATRFDSDDLMSAGSADLMRIFFRLNGLQWWTDTLRESMELGTANWMGNIRNTSYDRLSADTKRLFEQYGITTAEWDVMRQATVDAADKRVYVVPEQITKLDLDIFKNYLTAIGRTPTDEAAANARRDMADRLRNFIIDQAMTAVIEPDVRSRYFWTRGLRPGTFWGETARYIAQFKGFPTALTRQVFGREIYGRGYNSLADYLKYGKADMLGLAQLILMMSAFGYAAMAAKDLLKGKTPRDPTMPETWLAAMLQGGALGIYGDFLLGQSNRFGRNIIDTLAGPTFGLIGDLDELRQRAMRGDDVAASAFRTVISNTPFMNLFYARIVLDYLVLYQIQEALNPGYLRRMERRVEREQGQEFLLAPSEAVQ